MIAGTLFTINFGRLADRMVDEQICSKLKYLTIAEWLSPSFGTSQADDRVVASAIIMPALQNYFEHAFVLECDMPKVTLLSSAED